MLWDIVEIMKKEMARLASEGVKYIQIDAPRYSYFMDPKWREWIRTEMKVEPDAWLDESISADNACFEAARRPGVTLAIHLCRGNSRSHWYAEGGYDAIAEKMFGTLAVDRFLLEYDDSRSGTFEPLRFIPRTKMAVLGLISSKRPELESGDRNRRADQRGCAAYCRSRILRSVRSADSPRPWKEIWSPRTSNGLSCGSLWRRPAKSGADGSSALAETTEEDMAKVVLGVGSSHGPMLSTPPDMWHLRGGADRKNPKHFYRGESYDFAKLLAARQPGFADKITPEERKKRYDACQRALDKLAAKFREVKPDAVVIVGNDQRELFRDDNTPAFLVFTGSKIQNIPETEEAKAKFPPGIAIAEMGHCPPGGAEYAGSPDLGVHLVKSLMDQEFDVSESAQLPKVDGHEHGIPHAFGFPLPANHGG